MKRVFLIFGGLMLAGCGAFEGGLFAPKDRAPETAEAQATTTAPAPPAGANTADTLDTTSEEERAQAVADAGAAGGETDLGVTIASLGAVAEPGIWLKTPLVQAEARGRVEFPEKGTKVAVDLIPLDAEPGAGSQISLAAMRLLEADLTSLPELRVYRTE
uniref:hypothetical protein n=1 Tax=Roseovarius indicus TaxID=540747 RepID=UPI003B52EC6F